MSFLLSVAALTVVYLVVAKLERTPALRFRTLPSPRPYLATDAAWYLLAVLATAISVFVFRPVLSRLEIGPISARVNALPLAARFLLALAIFDFLSFAVHVGLHRSDRLWNFHKVHHSTLHLDGFATTRTHMFENLIRFVPPQAVLFVIGMPADIVAPTVAIAAIYGVSNHSNLGINLGWVEALCVTPDFTAVTTFPRQRKTTTAPSSRSGIDCSGRWSESTPQRTSATASPARSTPTHNASAERFVNPWSSSESYAHSRRKRATTTSWKRSAHNPDDHAMPAVDRSAPIGGQTQTLTTSSHARANRGGSPPPDGSETLGRDLRGRRRGTGAASA